MQACLKECSGRVNFLYLGEFVLKLEKISFDKVFYGKVSKLFMLFVIPALAVMLGDLFHVSVIDRVMTLRFVGQAILVIVLLLSFVRGCRITVGVNKKGIYNWERGWFYWQEIKDVKMKKASGKKKGCIFLELKKDLPFLRKLRIRLNFWSLKNVPAIPGILIDMPIDQMFELVKEYHKKYGERE